MGWNVLSRDRKTSGHMVELSVSGVRECKCDQQGDSNKNNICMNRTHTHTHEYTCRFSLLHTSNNNNNKCVHYASGDPCVGMGETAKENEGTGDKNG